MTTRRRRGAKRISAAEAKAKFAEVVSRVAFGGERYLIERRGKPIAAIVGIEDLERIDEGASDEPPKGALALVGAWGDLPDEWWDDFLKAVYTERERDMGRPVDMSGVFDD